ncbi:F0F1 ATP synthase subunit delta [Paracoccus sp. S-4012]|uniref:F0F1 ATP synthase subunit delta n=1 Tax=Paracoccus sp. S-4012 TaxID=2665648 RepID=UPI00132095B5|nr:F0F1 ATP synthase subunit delta [Paracoccus sp. S-4012]
MAQSASITRTVAARYAQAVFDIARAEGALDDLSREVDVLAEAIEGSEDLRGVLTSPVLSREEQSGAVSAVADAMKLGPLLKNTVALMGENRRLFALPQLLTALRGLMAEARGEVTAQVVSAQALSAAQAERLTRSLSEKSGKTVKLDTTVDEGLIGGMIVQLGSQMIDTSVRSKLTSLKNTMKEVG